MKTDSTHPVSAKPDGRPGPRVFAPGGPRSAQRVHMVSPGAKVSSSSAAQAVKPALDDDLVLTPGGWRPKSRVHLLRPGTILDKRQLATVPRAPRIDPGAARPSIRSLPPSNANWISYAGWLNTVGSPIVSFSTTWTVPPPPAAARAQLIYFFNGIEPADYSIILQPVLQWGDSGPDEDGVNRTGPFWSVASWSVGADAHHTPHVQVHPGDTLVGLMKLTDQSNGQFAYSCEFAGITGTDHSLVNTSELIWCSHTLEAYETDSNDNPPYDLRSLAEYPAADSIAFESISVQTAAGLIATLWDPQNVVTNFGEHTLAPGTASTDSEVTIFFH